MAHAHRNLKWKKTHTFWGCGILCANYFKLDSSIKHAWEGKVGKIFFINNRSKFKNWNENKREVIKSVLNTKSVLVTFLQVKISGFILPIVTMRDLHWKTVRSLSYFIVADSVLPYSLPKVTILLCVLCLPPLMVTMWTCGEKVNKIPQVLRFQITTALSNCSFSLFRSCAMKIVALGQVRNFIFDQ